MVSTRDPKLLDLRKVIEDLTEPGKGGRDRWGG